MRRMLVSLLIGVAPLTAASAVLAHPPRGDRPAHIVAAHGSRLQVFWGGQWYDATVLAVRGGAYLIRYDGWSSSWNEWVGASRLRFSRAAVAVRPVETTWSYGQDNAQRPPPYDGGEPMRPDVHPSHEHDRDRPARPQPAPADRPAARPDARPDRPEHGVRPGGQAPTGDPGGGQATPPGGNNGGHATRPADQGGHATPPSRPNGQPTTVRPGAGNGETPPGDGQATRPTR